MTNKCSTLFNINLSSIESTVFVIVNCTCRLSKRPWQNVTGFLKSPLHWLCNWDLIGTRVPLSDWQETDWGCHKNCQLLSWEPQGEIFRPVRSLIPWEYSHRRVGLLSGSVSEVPFKQCLAFTSLLFKMLQFWSNLSQRVLPSSFRL